VDDLIVIGTSAVRSARNMKEFLGRVKRETGFEIKPISGTEEARKTFLGVILGIGPIQHPLTVVIDIGGGSTEFISGQGGKPVRMTTIDLGVVTLAEKYLTTDPISPGDFTALETAIEKRLKPICNSIAAEKPFELIGTAGTITTLAAMDQKLDQYDPARIHRYRLKKTSVIRMLKEFLSRTARERSLMPSLEKGREDIIVAGTAILAKVMDLLDCGEILISDYGLREGVLLDFYLKKYETNQ
jgi:exopolyphosphatase/guanosine-5'-triphosphate,3'-diphosphate pyrophosphatase